MSTDSDVNPTQTLGGRLVYERGNPVPHACTGTVYLVFGCTALVEVQKHDENIGTT